MMTIKHKIRFTKIFYLKALLFTFGLGFVMLSGCRSQKKKMETHSTETEIAPKDTVRPPGIIHEVQPMYGVNRIDYIQKD